MDDQIYRYTLEYAPVTYSTMATQHKFIGTPDEFTKWFEDSVICGYCRSELESERLGGERTYHRCDDSGNWTEEVHVDEPDPLASPWSTGCGCEWEITRTQKLSNEQLQYITKYREQALRALAEENQKLGLDY